MPNTSNQIIVLEGLPASGKTSLANYLRDQHGLLKVNESLGQLGANDTTDQKIVFEETLQKYAQAKQTQGLSIIDRGYPSMLAWDYCAEKLGYADDLTEKTKWIKQSIKSGELFEPLLYVYLSVQPEKSLIRRPRQETKIDVWSGLRGMQYCLEYYESFFQPSKKINYLCLDSNQPIDNLAKLVMDKIKF